MFQKLLGLFKKSPKSNSISFFEFPSGKSRINFPPNWLMVNPSKGESIFTFYNNNLQGVLYASELTNQDPNYKYDSAKSLEINAKYSPSLIDISKYGTVAYYIPDQRSNMTYKHFDVGFKQTLIQLTWITPNPDDQTINKEIELILESIRIE